jgi:hypothetical protein
MELRLYSFVNFYLTKSIQAGIQTGHCAVDLVRKYDVLNTVHKQIVHDWADNHKTFIILNGGDMDSMINTVKIIEKLDYPHCIFHESRSALDGILTCVSVVLPETVFAAREVADNSPRGTLYSAPYYKYEKERDIGYPPIRHTYVSPSLEYQFLKILKGSPLA